MDDVLFSILKLDSHMNNPVYVRNALDQAKLLIDDGGLGVGLPPVLADAAYAASFISCFSTVASMCPSVLEAVVSPQPGIGIIDSFRAAVSTIHYKDYDAVSILELSGINILNGEHLEQSPTGKLQHKFMEAHYKAEKEHFIQSLRPLLDAKECIARYVSTCGVESGSIMLAAPKTPLLQMTPGQFRIMMYRRLGLNIPTIADGSKCNCSNRPIIDKKGIHIVTVCKKGQTRHQIHSRMNQELADRQKIIGTINCTET